MNIRESPGHPIGTPGPSRRTPHRSINRRASKHGHRDTSPVPGAPGVPNAFPPCPPPALITTSPLISINDTPPDTAMVDESAGPPGPPSTYPVIYEAPRRQRRTKDPRSAPPTSSARGRVGPSAAPSRAHQ